MNYLAVHMYYLAVHMYYLAVHVNYLATPPKMLYDPCGCRDPSSLKTTALDKSNHWYQITLIQVKTCKNLLQVLPDLEN